MKRVLAILLGLALLPLAGVSQTPEPELLVQLPKVVNVPDVAQALQGQAKKKHARGHKPLAPAVQISRRKKSYALHAKHTKALPKITAPAYDCRTLGIVPPIVDQGQCGSCWDFSGTSICTSAMMKALGTAAPGPLSEQYTLDCGQNGGCNGDDNTTVTAWALKAGLPTTAAYGPYQGGPGNCKSNVTLYQISAWGYCTPDNSGEQSVANTQDIKNAMVAYGPIGSGIDASSGAWDNYSGGVYTAANSTNIDHDIVLVGWQDDATIAGGGYWILRNSWGTSWGESGYMRIGYGSCGVGWEAIWAKAAGPTPTPVPPTPVPPTPVPPGPAPTPPAPANSITFTVPGATVPAYSFTVRTGLRNTQTITIPAVQLPDTTLTVPLPAMK